MKQYRSSDPENKRKHSEYMKQYRASDPENKRKNNEYMKQYRTTTALAKQNAAVAKTETKNTRTHGNQLNCI